ncbi:hypothetical protein D3C81_1698300 [compost metagenome]
MLLHHLVFAGTAGGSLHTVRHLAVGVDLLDDAADNPCTGHSGEGAADEHAGLLGRTTGTVECRVYLRQVAIDRL